MFTNNTLDKRVLYIIGATLLVLIIGIASYFLFFRQTNTSNTSSGSNPFGTSDGTTGPSQNGGGTPNQPANGGSFISGENGIVIWKVYDKPVSGAIAIEKGSTTIIRFVDKATGNIYQQDTVKQDLVRISNTTIPKTQDVTWGKDGNSLLFRYEENGIIKSLFGKISTTTVPDQGIVSNKYLLEDILGTAALNNQDKLVYLLTSKDITGVVASSLDGSAPSTIFASKLSEWKLSYPKDSSVIITTKASSQTSGFSYLINTKTKSFTKILGEIRGLTTLSDNKVENILYSSSKNASYGLGVYVIKNKTSTSLVPPTLTEKCAWSWSKTLVYCGVPNNAPAGEYPDIWYQGKVTLSDSLWVYDVARSTSLEIAKLHDLTGEDIDVIDISLSSSGKLLLFRNKKDHTLWAMKVDPNIMPPEYFD
jgi:hypothetical protein